MKLQWGLEERLPPERLVIRSPSGPEGCFMHGQTYMANPLACAVASENLSILMEGKWKSQVRQIEVQLKKELVPLLEHPHRG
ncbi:AKR_collapsed_G0035000.mRNA.1.CDS.1 [Saccharomyces cerevisiae]|nr:AKR_collapsed_G0035000.mRNA.1.CDS.1 [Saccharomyces cerevisiae]